MDAVRRPCKHYLTLASSLCVGAMIVVAARLHPASAAAPLCALLMFGYIIYDHADGMHARRTGTSGPLGEYLDHYLDAFHGALAVIAMFLLAGQAHSVLLAPLVWSVLLAGTATMAEEKELGALYFGLFGPLEGMLLTLAFMISWCVPDISHSWFAPLPLAGSWFNAAVAVGFIGGVATGLASIKRIGHIPLGFALYVFLSAALGYAAVRIGGGWWGAPLLLTLHGSDYTGRLLKSHLQGTSRPWPDALAPVLALGAFTLGVHASWVVGILGFYLLALNLQITMSNLGAFRSFWRWWNPPIPSLTSGS